MKTYPRVRISCHHYDETEFSTLVGKTLKACYRAKEDDYDCIVFEVDSGEVYVMHHHQDCCEVVSLEDVNGDLADLIGTPLLEAREVTQEDGDATSPTAKAGRKDDSFTWTFYHLRTKKGYVGLRWYGSSNGYYSERVSLCLQGKEFTILS